MIWEYIIIGIIVLLAIGYLGKKVFLPIVKPGSASCEKGCGCSADVKKKA